MSTRTRLVDCDNNSRFRLRSASSRRCETQATRLKIGERSFSFAGPTAWNSLPVSLQDIHDHQAFETKLWCWTFNRVYTTSDCCVCYALLVTYGISGALEKRELELDRKAAIDNRNNRLVHRHWCESLTCCYAAYQFCCRNHRIIYRTLLKVADRKALQFLELWPGR